MEKIRDIEVEMGLADVPDHYLEMYPCHYFDYFYGTSTGGYVEARHLPVQQTYLTNLLTGRCESYKSRISTGLVSNTSIDPITPSCIKILSAPPPLDLLESHRFH